MNKRKLIVFTTAPLVAGGLVIGGTAGYGAVTSPTTTLKACVVSRTGVMRLVPTATRDCRTGEKLIAWNVKSGQDGEDGLDWIFISTPSPCQP